MINYIKFIIPHGSSTSGFLVALLFELIKLNEKIQNIYLMNRLIVQHSYMKRIILYSERTFVHAQLERT